MSNREVPMPDGAPFEFWEDATTYGKVYHVAGEDPHASDDNEGTEEKPFATIGRAAAILKPAEKVVVHSGIYRECVCPARGGDGPDRMITYEAAPGEEVRVRGSEPWAPTFRASAGWRSRRAEGGPAVWMADLPAELFVGYNPFLATNVVAQYHSYAHQWLAEETDRFLMRRGTIFANGRPLRQVFRIRELAQTDGAFWVEEPGLRVHLRLCDDADPAGASLEITVREQVFAPSEHGLGHIRVKGFHFEHAADGVPVPQRAMVSTTRGHHWIIEDNEIRWANACGLDVGAQHWSAAQYEPRGGHVVRRNRISDCGICGIAGATQVDHTLVEGNVIERVGGLDIERIYECAGLKFHVANGVLIRGNVFRHIRHAAGLWLDVLNRNCRVSGNVFADIETILAGAYLECSHHLNVIDGNVFWDIRGVAKAESPKEAPQGGVGFRADSGENIVVAHNLFGRIPHNDAASLSLSQSDRLIGGRVGLCRRNKVLNNTFVQCPRRVLFGRIEENASDGNLLDAANEQASLRICHPQPEAVLNLAAWRQYYGQDLDSTETQIEADFDPDELKLVLKAVGELPACGPVPELHGAPAYSGPGPVPAQKWQQCSKGEKATLTFP